MIAYLFLTLVAVILIVGMAVTFHIEKRYR